MQDSGENACEGDVGDPRENVPPERARTTSFKTDLQKLKDGDDEAWDDAFGKLWGRAIYYSIPFYAPFLSHADREDIAITAITVLCRKIGKIENIPRLLRFFEKTIRNLTLKLVAREKTLKRGGGKVLSLDQMEEDDPPEDMFRPSDLNRAADHNTPYKQAVCLEEIVAFHDALNCVKKPLRDMLKDLWLNGLEKADVAKKYDLKEGTLDARLSRAKEQLRKILKPFYRSA